MSDASQGEGWWQAADGKWYAPEQHPDFQASGVDPTVAQPAAPVPPLPPTAAVPTTPPPGPPPGGPPVGPAAASNNARWIIVGVLAVAAVAIAAFLLLGGSSSKKNVAATSGSSSSSPSSSSSSSSSSSTRSSSSSTKSSSSSSSQPTEAQLQSLMLTASDISPNFEDTSFTPDTTSPAPCGQPNTDAQFPPVIDVGSSSSDTDGALSFQEELTTYKDAQTAAQAFQVGKQGINCTQGKASDGSPITISPAKDVSSSLGVPGAIEVDIQGSSFEGQLFAASKNNAIVVFIFAGPVNADTTGVPSPESIAQKGIQKLGS